LLHEWYLVFIGTTYVCVAGSELSDQFKIAIIITSSVFILVLLVLLTIITITCVVYSLKKTSKKLVNLNSCIEDDENENDEKRPLLQPQEESDRTGGCSVYSVK